MRIPVLFAGVAALGLVAFSACGDDDSTNATPTSATTAAASASTSTAAASSTGAATKATSVATSVSSATTAAASATTAAGKVNANTATRAQIQAALEAAGVPSAAQWAKEVEEYRPYPADDPNFGKLRQNLAKYNPGPGVVDKIVSVLVP